MGPYQTSLVWAALFLSSPAWAQSTPAPGALPGFETSSRCETIKGYDPDWDRHGDRYGHGLGADQGDFVSGFYQLSGHGDRIYAAFGGALTKSREPVKGVTPGALVVLDARTLKLERFIPLPFHAHALAVQPAQNRVIATHTRANAFSMVDLATGAVRCFKPNTGIAGEAYSGRYVATDGQGHFYISYFAGRGDKARSVIAKFDGDGQAAVGYTPTVTEAGMSLPAFYRNGHVVTGGKGPKMVSVADGQVRRLLPDVGGLSIYNYAAGPGERLLAISHKNDASPNLLLIDPAYNSTSAILTGSGSLEAAYIAESGQVFSTNFSSNTVSVAELSSDGSAFVPRRFVNIALEGKPLGLYTRHTAHGSEVFVTTKWNGDVIQKIVIAHAVHGIEGIERPGMCTLTTFDLADRSVSPARPCNILDAKTSYRAAHQALQDEVRSIEQEIREDREKLAQARAALQAARKAAAGADILALHEQGIAALEESIRDAQESWAEETLNRDMFARLSFE